MYLVGRLEFLHIYDLYEKKWVRYFNLNKQNVWSVYYVLGGPRINSSIYVAKNLHRAWQNIMVALVREHKKPLWTLARKRCYSSLSHLYFYFHARWFFCYTVIIETFALYLIFVIAHCDIEMRYWIAIVILCRKIYHYIIQNCDKKHAN